MLFPTLCVDNFFNNPDKVLPLAKECPMERTAYRPGLRSPCLSEINSEVYNYVNIKILKLFYPEKHFSYVANTHFQSTSPNENVIDGWVHQDSDFMLTAIVYLNHCDIGTSIFTRKNEFIIPQAAGDIKHDYFRNYKSASESTIETVRQVRQEVNSQYDESISIKGKYNRMMCFDGDSYHTTQDGICNEERLILISFIKDIKIEGSKTTFPIPEMNSL